MTVPARYALPSTRLAGQGRLPNRASALHLARAHAFPGDRVELALRRMMIRLPGRI
jgi:hypothetical protein